MKALFIILDCNCPCANPQLNTEDWIIVGTGAAFIIAALCGLAWLSLKQRKAPKEVSAHDQRINADRKLIEQYKEQMRVRRGFCREIVLSRGVRGERNCAVLVGCGENILHGVYGTY